MAAPKPGDERMGQLIENISIDDLSEAEVAAIKRSSKFKVAIIGVPCDEGVKRNKGRLGSADAPAAFRQMLARTGCLQNPEFEVDIRSRVRIFDLGDVPVPNDASPPASHTEADPLEVVHDEVKRRVKWALSNGLIPFVVGGGNDQSYGVARGLLEFVNENKALMEGKDYIGVINVDAHLDVRPLIEGDGGRKLRHSGSPFRLLLTDPLYVGSADERKDDGNQFVEYGAQGSQCSHDHADFVKSNNGRIIWLNELRGEIAPMSLALSRFRSALDSFGLKSNIFVSFDIDSIRSADCPGVSCPSPLGLTAEEAIALCLESGKRPNVAVFDMSEFNPRIESDRTSRLVANMFYYFCLGLAQRS